MFELTKHPNIIRLKCSFFCIRYDTKVLKIKTYQYHSSFRIWSSNSRFKFPGEKFIESFVFRDIAFQSFIEIAIKQVRIRVDHWLSHPFRQMAVGQIPPSPRQNSCWEFSKQINLKKKESALLLH